MDCNRIVILFPRVQPHGSTDQQHAGCYDGYAQTGPDYALRTGVQMRAIASMIARVSGRDRSRAAV